MIYVHSSNGHRHIAKNNERERSNQPSSTRTAKGKRTRATGGKGVRVCDVRCVSWAGLRIRGEPSFILFVDYNRFRPQAKRVQAVDEEVE